MRIGIITCHNVYNAGASLQAFALSKYLFDQGNEAEIIDYQPDYLQHYRLWGVNNPKYDRPGLREIYNILKLPNRIRERYSTKKSRFDAFTSENLPLSRKTYHTNEELLKDPPAEDLLIAGSDQIWNTYFKNGRDPSFYLNFADKNTKTASYAASFATEDIKEEYKNSVTKWINEIDYLSVREQSGVRIVHELGRSDVTRVVDPVFLIDRTDWDDMSESSKVLLTSPYILIYDFDQNEDLMKYAKTLAKKKGCETVSISENTWADKTLNSVGPIEFVWLVKHAEAVVTNSFHAMAFSVMYEKAFIVYDRKEAINTRIHDFLSVLGLTADSMQIDYRDVQKKLMKDIARSKQFLACILRSDQER